MVVDLCKLYVKGVSINDEIPGIEDPNFEIENQLIHILRIVLLI